MPELVPAGSIVELHQVVLPAGRRAPRAPEDTQAVPLELRVKGVLLRAARVGEEAEVTTAAGRRLSGTLVDPAPAYDHTFGAPVPELAPVGAELRALLA